MKLDLKPELKVQLELELELDAHEKECAKIDGNTKEEAD